MSNWIIVAIVYGCAAFLSIQLSEYVCKNIERFDDGPRAGKAPVPWIIGGMVVIGALLGFREPNVLRITVIGFVLCAVIAAWYSDATKGVIPDYFTLVPLAVVLVPAVAYGAYSTVFWAFVAFVPFASASYISKGRGMGWGDSKLAALGGAVLGEVALVAYSAACLAAVGVAYAQKRRSEPIAFGPYLAASIGGALLVRLLLA